jgi:hypothetical protein
MAENSASFQIELGVAGTSSLNAAATSLETIESRLTGAKSAAEKAAAAVNSAQASYNAAEGAFNRASKAVEKINVAMTTASGKTLENLKQRQVEATAAADKARMAMLGQAAALDRMKDAAGQASATQAQLAKDLARAQKAAGSGKLNDASAAFGKLGGPLGRLGQKATGSAEGVQKLFSSLGSTKGALALVGVGAAAAAASIIALGGAAVYGLGKLVVWSVKAADKTKRLDSLSDKFKKHVAGLFGKTKIDKLLNGVEDLVDLFDETTVTGKAMKTVFDSLIQPLVDGITAFLPKMRTAFIEFQILVLKALIAIKPFGSTILKVGEVMAIAAGVIVGLLVGALVVLTALVVGSVAFFGYLVVAVYRGIDAFFKLGGMLLDLVAPFIDLGSNLIMGLVKGITGAAGAVYDSIKGVVGGAIDAAKNMLGIASPSRVFAEIGLNTGAGMVEGVESTAGNVQGALESMVATPEAPDASSFGGKGDSHTFSIVINAPTGEASGIAEEVRRVLLETLEGDAMQLGAGVMA